MVMMHNKQRAMRVLSMFILLAIQNAVSQVLMGVASSPLLTVLLPELYAPAGFDDPCQASTW